MPKPYLCFAAVRRSITDGGFYVAGLTTDSGQLIHGRECPDGNTRRISSKAILGRFATYDEAKARADRLERIWAAYDVHVDGARHALRHARVERRKAVQAVVDHDRDVRTAEKNRRAAIDAIAAGREPNVAPLRAAAWADASFLVRPPVDARPRGMEA